MLTGGLFLTSESEYSDLSDTENLGDLETPQRNLRSFMAGTAAAAAKKARAAATSALTRGKQTRAASSLFRCVRICTCIHTHAHTHTHTHMHITASCLFRSGKALTSALAKRIRKSNAPAASASEDALGN